MPENKKGIKSEDSLTKLMLVVLVFFGFSALLLGILRLNSSLRPDSTFNNQTGEELNYNNQTEKSLTDLMQTDTDGDGLSDYDEMYIYHTSIYLTDSDSDGYSDKEEVEKGFDPNCPKGQNCRGVEETNNQIDINSNQTETGNSGSGLDQLTEEQKQQLMNLSPDQIRQLLLSSGQISQEELDKIDDETLKQVLKDALNNSK